MHFPHISAMSEFRCWWNTSLTGKQIYERNATSELRKKRFYSRFPPKKFSAQRTSAKVLVSDVIRLLELNIQQCLQVYVACHRNLYKFYSFTSKAMGTEDMLYRNNSLNLMVQVQQLTKFSIACGIANPAIGRSCTIWQTHRWNKWSLSYSCI